MEEVAMVTPAVSSAVDIKRRLTMPFKEPLYLPTADSGDGADDDDKDKTPKKASDSRLCCLLCDKIFPPGGASVTEGSGTPRDAASPDASDAPPGPDVTSSDPVCLDPKAHQQAFLSHLLEQHSLVIEDVPAIADLPAYCRYWKQRLMTTELSWLCAKIETTENKTFYMLTRTLPEDVRLREDLRRRQQEAVLRPLLEQKRRERADESAVRTCLFCRKTFQGKSHDLFQHMYIDHNFNVGRADNLIHVDEFLELLRTKLDQLLCLYCEKTFKSWDVLKEHMRKKQHKQLNPNNTAYDRFYIVSYVAGGDRDRDRDEHDEAAAACADSFEDWTEEQRFDFVCLFCEHSERRGDDVFAHMRAKHAFDFASVRTGLGFYEQVKLINYIRRQTHINVCYLCQAAHECREELLRHLNSTHKDDGGMPTKNHWDQPGYFFPTYENDQLLLALEDNPDEANEEWVVPEDTVQPNTDLLEQLSLDGGKI